MNDEERKILEFILNSNINIESGYSYTQILDFLNYLKHFYKEMVESRELKIRENKNLNLQNKNLDEKYKLLEEKLRKRNKEYKNLCSKLTRKLSLKERLLGKIILDIS